MLFTVTYNAGPCESSAGRLIGPAHPGRVVRLAHAPWYSRDGRRGRRSPRRGEERNPRPGPTSRRAAVRDGGRGKGGSSGRAPGQVREAGLVVRVAGRVLPPAAHDGPGERCERHIGGVGGGVRVSPRARRGGAGRAGRGAGGGEEGDAGGRREGRGGPVDRPGVGVAEEGQPAARLRWGGAVLGRVVRGRREGVGSLERVGWRAGVCPFGAEEGDAAEIFLGCDINIGEKFRQDGLDGCEHRV